MKFRELWNVAACGAAALMLFTACGKSDNTAPAAAAPAPVTVPPPPDVPRGPGARLACSRSGKNAFDTYGANAFVAVNKKIIANVGAEMKAHGTKNLGDSFTKVGSGNPPSTSDDAATFEGKLAAFLVYVYGGPAQITYVDGKTYAGPQDMVAAHTGLRITGAQFDYFVADIVVPALKSSGVAMADISSCFAPPLLDPAFKASIVGH